MMKRNAALAALMVLVLASLASAQWTTNKSSGTSKKVFAFSSTGRVIPDSVRAGLTFISVSDQAGTGVATFMVYGEDVIGDSMLVTLGAGGTWWDNCPHGIDSVVVVTNATTLGFHVSN